MVLVGFGWLWLVLVGFGWFWLVFVGFCWFWLVLVGFGWFDSRTEFCRTFSRILIFNGQNLIGYWVLGNGCELGNGYVLGINLPSNQVIKHSYQSQ